VLLADSPVIVIIIIILDELCIVTIYHAVNQETSARFIVSGLAT